MKTKRSLWWAFFGLDG